MLNGFDIIHGGVVFAASDSCFAFAWNSHGRIALGAGGYPSLSPNLRKQAKRCLLKPGNCIWVTKPAYTETTTTNESGETVAIFKGTAYRTSREVLS
jgi:acyl-CoA thioesterase